MAIVGWLPYLRIKYPQQTEKRVTIGKAIFLPDTDDIWTQHTGRTRPHHLRIFHDFPLHSEPQEARGTVVVSDDSDWLRRYMDEAVSILYFLGDRPGDSRPAEAFHHQELHLSSESHAGDLAQFWTKHGPLLETAESLVIHPPLPVRGHQEPYEVDLVRPEHQKLLERFASNPLDRLVVATRQYFRSQFSDSFTSPAAEDFASFCSVIEAALDLDTRHGAGDKFIEALITMFGDKEGFRSFFHGLYVARSLHVHGVTTGDMETASTQDAQDFQFFESIKGRLTVLRVLARDVILRVLGRTENVFEFGHPDSAKPYMRQALHSDSLWTKMKQVLTQAGAADTLRAMTDEAFGSVEDLALSVGMTLQWDLIRAPIDKKQVEGAIRSCVLVIVHLTTSDDPDYVAADELGKAVDTHDIDRIRAWCQDHADWEETHIESGKRIRTIKVLAGRLAAFFAPS